MEMDQTLVYLNTGTAGIVPKSVHERAAELRLQLHRNPTNAAWRDLWDDLWRSRTRLAQHIGTTPDRLIFFTNISQAINTLILSIDLPPGSEILMTDHEYGAMHMAWLRAAHRRGWQIRIAQLPIPSEDPSDYIHSIESQWTDATRILYLSHVLYSTGHVLPISDIIRAARERGLIVVVDGAHAPGMLPLDLSNLGAHFYAANLHKWFCSPVGAAFLFVERGMEKHLEPWQVSWAYHDDRSHPDEPNEFGSTPWIRQFEMEGTRDLTPWRVIDRCCDFQETIPYPSRLQRFHELGDCVRDGLSGVGGLRCVTPQNPTLRGGLTSFIAPSGVGCQGIRQRLWEEHRIEINAVELNGAEYLRVSTHVYNNEQEIDTLARALRQQM